MTREALIAARLERGMSRQLLSDMIDVVRSYVFQIEKGNRDPSPELMLRWAKALKVKPADIWLEPDLERIKLRIKDGKTLLASVRRAA
jgi:transcriptional regulator with XRE-family HTH domain